MSDQDTQAHQPVIPTIEAVNGGSHAAALDAVRGAIVPLDGGQPQAEVAPQQVPEAAPVQPEAGEAPQAGLYQENSLVELTGEETAEQVAAHLGVSPENLSENLRARMSELANQRTTSVAEAERLRQEVATLTAILQQNQQPQQQQPQPTPGEWFKPNIQVGEDASEEEFIAARVAEMLAPSLNEALMGSGKELLSTVAPFLKSNLDNQVEAQWSELEPTLKQLGVTRAEVEPYVVDMQQREPHRPLRSMVFDAATGQLGKAPKAPQVPTTSTPGAGRQARPQAQVPEQKESTFDEVLRKAQSRQEQHAAIGNHIVGNMVGKHSRTG